ncbi:MULTISPECIES: IS630 transposase-related protein [unclassified Streptococcus]|uniref:IS630 transposase-related protein n=2 Tax=unclassified Streptococcus TaxID=2608887 RepID=UPI00277D0918|nr:MULTISPECIES: IS630 transposase-related protein [unclassified Streptococcus]
MAYDLDFRNRVLEYVTAGHSKKATCALFGISTNTLYVWEKQLSEQGHLERKKRVAKSRKIPLEQLEAYVQQHPDAFLRELAEHFNCRISSVWAALKQLAITLKKDDNL